MCLMVSKGDMFVWDTELLVKSNVYDVDSLQEKEMY